MATKFDKGNKNVELLKTHINDVKKMRQKKPILNGSVYVKDVLVILTEVDKGNFELAYAITFYKFQGSGFDEIIVPLSPTSILDKGMLYTSLKRPISSAAIVVSIDTVNDVIQKGNLAVKRTLGVAYFKEVA
jgi:hypothetical protein